MKLKLLIAPLLVLLIIIMAIWVVAPAYQKLQIQKEELAAARLKLADVQEKNAQAAKLKQLLADNAAQKEMLLKYLPEKAQEEVIMGNLNALMLGEGVAISNLSIMDDSRKNSASAAPVAAEAGGGEIAPAALAVNSIGAGVGIAGPYEKIKSFLGKLAALRRGNDVISLKINNAAAAAGNLQADMVLKFYYFAGGDSAAGANSNVFSKGDFDMAAVEQIKSRLNTEVIPVNIGETGKANPFLP